MVNFFQDESEFMEHIVTTYYAHVKQVDLIQDNLNTHKYGSFYENLSLASARTLCDKLVFRFTPKHGSWLNMAEPGGRSHRVLGFGPSMSPSAHRVVIGSERAGRFVDKGPQ